MSQNLNTTASVYVYGVSLGCFNQRERQWEVVFIEGAGHALAITIIKIKDGNETPFHRETPISPGSRIRVTLNGNARPSPGGSHQDDFRKIVDVDTKVHPHRPRLQRPTVSVTELIVSPVSSHTELYAVAGMDTQFPVNLTLKNDHSHVFERFESIATTAGVDITYNQGEVVITVEGPGKEIFPPMPHEPGVRYVVWFNNACPRETDSSGRRAEGRGAEPAGTSLADKVEVGGNVVQIQDHSDFTLNYAVLDVPDREQRDLRNAQPGRGEGAICNYSHLSLRDGMFPLE